MERTGSLIAGDLGTGLILCNGGEVIAASAGNLVIEGNHVVEYSAHGVYLFGDSVPDDAIDIPIAGRRVTGPETSRG